MGKSAKIFNLIGLFLLISLCLISFTNQSSNAQTLPKYNIVTAVNGYENKYKRERDGHFYINAQYKKQNSTNTITFLLDTGATDLIISLSDAQKLGVEPNKLVYNKQYHTGNGSIWAAPIIISKLKFDNFVIENIEANVINTSTSQSVLGMSIIKEFIVQINNNQLQLSLRNYIN